MSNDTVMMPRELTAENGAKALLSGEFHEQTEVACINCDNGMCDGEECELCDGKGFHVIQATVSWTTIKEIYAKAVEHIGVEPGLVTDDEAH